MMATSDPRRQERQELFDQVLIDGAQRRHPGALTELVKHSHNAKRRYLPAGWCSNPFVMFGEDQRAAFRWFCHWAFEVSRRGPGKKVFYVDELWHFADAQSLPAELEKIACIGRSENLELLSSTQHPRDYHRDIRAEVTEWICFNTTEPGGLDAVRPYFRGVDRVAELPRGSFIGYNRESGAELAGKLF